MEEGTLSDRVVREGFSEGITFEPGCELWEEMCCADTEQRNQGVEYKIWS